MSSIDNTSIDNNKDFDNNGDTKVWSDDYLQNAIFNQLMDIDNKYKNQGLEKFRYFRINSPSAFFDIDIIDLPDEIITQLEVCIKGCQTKDEKYNRLNSIFTRAIFSIYKNHIESQILSTTKEDKDIVRTSINEMPSLLSHKWRLIDSNKKLLQSSSSLSELLEYIPQPSLLSIPEDQHRHKKQRSGNSNEKVKGCKDKENDAPVKDDGENAVSILDSIKKRYIEIFQDQFNEPYITIKINSHVECIPLEGNRFKNVIRKEYFEKEDKILKEDELNAILKLIEAQLMSEEVIQKVELKLRVAKTAADGIFYYDLTNPKWEVIKITSEEWDIVKDNTIPLFKRYENNYSPQVYPSKEKDKTTYWNRFLKLFNLESAEDILLLSVYTISLFIPDIPRAILVLRGSGGGAKTMTFKMIKNIVDPGTVDTFSFPKQINDLVQTLSHHHLNLFDNVSSISEDVSDFLCRAITGAGFSKRALYKTDTDFVYKFKRGVGVNGINLVTTRQDFLDRSLVIKLKRIPKDKRRKEEDIEKEFEELRPFVLGHIFDILVKVLKYKEEHKGQMILKELPRMADFAEWCEIIARCLGYPNNEFIQVYEENILNQNDEVIESSPVAESILLFVGEMDKDYWQGTPTELYKKLTDIVAQIKPELKNSNLWPKASNKLTARINEVEPNLKEKGIEAITGARDGDGNRIIKINNLRKKKNKEISHTDKISDTDILFNPHIHRLGNSDIWKCERCYKSNDIHYMKQHICS
jgi:hypothetical protein